MGISKQNYSPVAIGLHWLIAGLMIYMLFLGEELIKVRPGSLVAAPNPSLHVTIGMAILLLSFLRLAWRVANPPPSLPATMKRWEVVVSHAVHGLFYALLIGIPLTGWLALGPYSVRHSGHGAIEFFGLVNADMLPNLGKLPGELHGIGQKLGIALVFLHAGAALKHQFWDKNNLMRRMLWR